MATFVNYSPAGTISRAMFNFDAVGISNYRLTGTILVSVSDDFAPGEHPYVYTSGPAEVVWTAEMISNIQGVLATIASFANVTFQWAGNFDTAPPGFDSTPNPGDVGRAQLSDININLIYRPDSGYGGLSGGSRDSLLGYTGAAGDIYLNLYWYDDQTLGLDSEARQTLMHEFGHSLGLSHPHSSVNPITGERTLTSDFAATANVGFGQLGFRILSGADMDKEYFTIMSYDDQPDLAFTPMILDVIALHQAYGEGPGTHGSGNDTITAGNVGFRTYFDKGGTDTIDMSFYDTGAYLHMGVSITGAAHQVGVLMSAQDGANLPFGLAPISLRWFYGEYENALGSAAADRIIGNSLNNVIEGGGGNDSLTGGAGVDTAVFSGMRADYAVLSGGGTLIVTDNVGGDGSDSLSGFERVQFTDGTNFYGSDRADRFTSGAPGESFFFGFGGNDTYTLTGGNNTIVGGNGVNKVTTGAGNDTITTGAGGDTIAAGAGTNVVNAGNGTNKITTLDGQDAITAGTGNDTINAGDGNNSIVAGDGTNKVTTGAGDDTISSGVGNDTIAAGAGTNVINAGEGANKITTLDGQDTITGGNGNDTISAGGGDNTISAGDGTNKVTTGAGVDTIVTGGGNDTVAAGEGGNTVYAGGGTDKITTGGGIDVIYGGAGNDTITAGAGDDRLAGGDGNDTLTAGTGADIFGFDTAPNATTNLDRIMDFLAGTDQIELENAIFTALAEGAALPAAEFHGGAGVTAAADGDDHLLYNSSSGALYYDPDGTGTIAAIQIARLSSNLALTGADFVVV